MKLASTLISIAVVASRVVSGAAAAAAAIKPSLLIFTKTEGYRHDSIPSGIKLITSIAKSKRWSVDATEDSSVFTTKGLSMYTTLVFIHTTGNFLQASESMALHDFLLKSNSWVGIHAAADYGNSLPAWYGHLVGGQFFAHPCSPAEYCSPAQEERYPPYGNIRPDTVNVTHSHPSTKGLAKSNKRTDEWYTYTPNPSHDSKYTILAALNQDYIDEITPEILRMQPDHPISWYSIFGGKAKAFFTGMGHTNESYVEPYLI